MDSTTGDRPGKSMVMRGLLRRVLTWLFSIALVAIVLAVAAEWVIAVLRDKGAYEHAGRRWDSIVSAVLAFVTSPVPLTGMALLGGLVGGLWLDQLLLKKERNAPEPPPLPNEQEALESAIAEAYKALGMAVGSRDVMLQQVTVASIETLFLQLNQKKDIVTPDLRRDGEWAGNLRALLYLNYVAPTLRLLDFETSKARAAEIVPRLNVMPLEELRERTGQPDLGPYGWMAR